MVHQYKQNGYNIVLDTCSGSVHTVDDVAYDMIEMFKTHTEEEIALMREYILGGKDFANDERLAKHKEWFKKFEDKYTFNEDNIEDIIKREIGNTFVRVLEDAGVYKQTEDGHEAFLRFIDHVNSN